MRDVGDKFLLIVLECVQFVCHVVQRGGEISDLIVGVDIDLRLEIAGSVLIRGSRDSADRYVYNVGEQNQYNKRCNKKQTERFVGNHDQTVRVGYEAAHRLVDDDIAAYFVIDGNWRKYTQSLRGKLIVKSAYLIISAAEIRDIKAGDRNALFRKRRICSV